MSVFSATDCIYEYCPEADNCALHGCLNQRALRPSAKSALSAADAEWAIVEVFGHRRHAGRTREEERFGSKFLRIDIPIDGDPAAHGWKTVFYGGASIFSFTLCSEAEALAANRPYEPLARYALAAPAPDDSEAAAL